MSTAFKIAIFITFLVSIPIIFNDYNKVILNVHNTIGPVLVVHNDCKEDMFIKFYKPFDEQTQDLIKMNSNITYSLAKHDFGIAYILSLDLENNSYAQFIYDFRRFTSAYFSIGTTQDENNIPLNLKTLNFTNNLIDLTHRPSWIYRINRSSCPNIIEVYFYKKDKCNNPCNVFNNRFCCWNKYKCYSKNCDLDDNLINCNIKQNYYYHWINDNYYASYQLTLCGY